MNKIYNVIWNRELGRHVVTSELATRRSKSKTVRAAGIALSCLLTGPALTLLSMPASAYVAGNGAVQGAPGNTVVGDGATGTVVCKNTLNAGPGPDGSPSPLGDCLNSTVVGTNALADGGATTAVGEQANANGQAATSIGALSQSSQFSTAVGADAVATGGWAVAMGQGAHATGIDSSAVGTNAWATAARSAAIGSGAHATADDAMAIGRVAVASGLGSFALGTGTETTGVRATGIGNNAVASGVDSIALGTQTNSSGLETIAAGRAAEAHTEYSIVMGSEAGMDSTDTGPQAIYIGKGAGSKTVGTGTAGGNVGIGSYALVGSEASRSVALGYGAGQYTSGSQNVFIGSGSVLTGTGTGANTVGQQNIAIGSSLTGMNVTGDNNIAFGTGAGSDVTASNTIAIGTSSSASLADGVALGSNSVANTAGGIDGYTPIGADAAHMAGITATTSTLGAVSVGDAATGQFRQITGVAAGTENSDAVNVAQLSAVADTANSGWNISAQGANSTNVAPGGSVDMANTDGNIVISKTTDNNDVNFDLGSDINIDNSITVGGTTINGDSITTNNLTVSGDTQLGDNFFIDNSGAHYDGPITEGDNIVNKNYVDNSVNENKTRYYSVNDNGVQGANYDNDGATGINALAAGINASASVDDGIALGSNSVANTAGGIAGYIPTGADAAQVAAITATTSTLGAVSVGDAASGQFRQITGVAAGTADSDAVNVAQLDAVTATADAAGQGWDISAQGANSTNVAPGGSVDMANTDGNIVISKTTDNNDVNFDLGSDINIDNSITVGGTTIDGDSVTTNNLTVNGDTKLGDNFYIDNSGAHYDGPITEGDNIVNKNYVDNSITENKTHYYSINDNGVQGGNYDNDGATGINALAAGVNASASVDDGIALGSNSVANTAGGIAGYIPTGADAAQVAAITATTSTLGAVSVGDAASGQFRQITGVAAGTADSDAVNVAQLDAVTATADAAGQGWDISAQGANSTNVAPGGSVDLANTDGNIEVSKATDSNNVNFDLASDISIDNSITVGGTTIDGDSVTTNNLTVNGDTKLGDNFYIDNSGAHYDGPITEGDNIVNKNYVDNSVNENKTRYYSVNDNGVQGANYDNDGATGINALAAGINASASVDDGIALGSNSVANTAGGIAGYIPSNADAAQLAAINATTSTLGAVSVGDAASGQFRQITGVAAGTENSDAVNVAQLKAVGDATSDEIDAAKTHYYSVNDNGVQGGNYDNDGATARNALAAGVNVSASGAGSTAVGYGAIADHQAATAIGQGAHAAGFNTFAAGTNATANQQGDVAIGFNSVAIGSGDDALAATAIGKDSQAMGPGSTALGYQASATAGDSLALGSGATASNGRAIAAGAFSKADGQRSMAFGLNAQTTRDAYAGIAIGPDAQALARSGLALGEGARAYTIGGVAIGSGSRNEREAGVAGYVPTGATTDQQAAIIATTSTSGDVSVGRAFSGQYRQITSVAAGTQDSDATNVAQLKAVAAAASDQADAAKTHYYSVNDNGVQGGNYDNDGATGINALAAGVNARASVEGGIALGSSSVSNRAAGIASYVPASASDGQRAAIAATTSTQGAFSIGDADAGIFRQITGVAAGTMDSDAVNVAQLKAVSAAAAAGAVHYYSVNDNGTQGANYDNTGATGTNAMAAGVAATAAGEAAVAMGNEAQANAGNSVAVGNGANAKAEGGVALGSGSVADREAGAAGYVPDGASDTQQAAIAATTSTQGAVSVGDAASGQFRQITGVAAGSEDSDAVNVAQLKAAGDATSDEIEASKTRYYSVNDGGKQSANYNNDGATGNNAIAAGTNASAAGSSAVAVGDGAQAAAASSVAIGNNAKATTSNSVALGSNSVASRDNSVSVGSAGNERQITNVAAGTADTDAVNVSQLEKSTGDINNRIDNTYNSLRHDLKDQDDTLSAGIAGAMAAAALPQPYSPGASMVSAGVGNYRGQSSLAIGVSTISDNGKWVSKLAGTADSQGEFGVSVGVGYQW